MRTLALAAGAAGLVALAFAAPAQEVADMAPREGWRVIATDVAYADLLERLRAAVPEAGMAVVTEAGPTEAAASRGVDIPGNRVVGVFNNAIAVETLRLSTAAMIEAPIRFYVTENVDGTGTLSWKLPSAVFAPYVEDVGALAPIAADLDARFETIASTATADGG